MGSLLAGAWRYDDHLPTDDRGAFIRETAAFRERVTADSSSEPHAVAGRYHLYVSYACPWAHRVLIARTLLGLEHAISISIAHPVMLENGWVFRQDEAEDSDPGLHADYLWQLYLKAAPNYTGRATVPVLWDRARDTIVNNESRDIMRMLSREFTALRDRTDLDLAPVDLESEINQAIQALYEPINNGVYRCGFARTQVAYERAVREVFDALRYWEGILAKQRYLCGDRFTEADICLFTTLFRFDLVYATHFKCNLRRLVDFPNLWGFVRDVYAMPGVAETCNVPHIKQHYFGSHPSVNPTRIVPVGPELDFSAPHHRERLSRGDS